MTDDPTYDFIDGDGPDDPADAEEIEGWRDVSDTTGHDHHWHYGERGSDEFHSIRAADENVEPLGGFWEGWTVEIYPDPSGASDIDRTRHDSREEAMNRVFELMVKHP